MCIYIYIYIYMHVCVYIYIYIYMYVRMGCDIYCGFLFQRFEITLQELAN